MMMMPLNHHLSTGSPWMNTPVVVAWAADGFLEQTQWCASSVDVYTFKVCGCSGGLNLLTMHAHGTGFSN